MTTTARASAARHATTTTSQVRSGVDAPLVAGGDAVGLSAGCDGGAGGVAVGKAPRLQRGPENRSSPPKALPITTRRPSTTARMPATGSRRAPESGRGRASLSGSSVSVGMDSTLVDSDRGLCGIGQPCGQLVRAGKTACVEEGATPPRRGRRGPSRRWSGPACREGSRCCCRASSSLCAPRRRP